MLQPFKEKPITWLAGKSSIPTIFPAFQAPYSKFAKKKNPMDFPILSLIFPLKTSIFPRFSRLAPADFGLQIWSPLGVLLRFSL
jgi:hypothetical protein